MKPSSYRNPLFPVARSKHPAYPDRFHVPDKWLDWHNGWESYAPIEFTHDVVLANDRTKKDDGWADPLFDHKAFEYVNTSFETAIYDTNCMPLNPHGRTGMKGRGLLGKWGANHAADPIVTRWHYNKKNKEWELQVVLIKRKDTGAWAIPGGMVDPGEHVSATLSREFGEEAGVLTDDQRTTLFSNGRFIYRGHVYDPRNTDNAWMETTVLHFHADEELGNQIKLEARDDATAVRWVNLDDDDIHTLYASHTKYIQMMLESFVDKQNDKKKHQSLKNNIQKFIS